MTKKMQIFGLFICTQSALHVSGDVFAHYQEHLTVITVPYRPWHRPVAT